MSTRSLTHIHDTDDSVLLTFYRHSDGYPSGMGAELAEFLDGFKIANGISETRGKIANGLGCLAAQIVKHFKDGVGGVYIYAPNSNDVGEEYVYHVRGGIGESPRSPAGVSLEVCKDDGKQLFLGKPSEFAAWLTAYEAKRNEE